VGGGGSFFFNSLREKKKKRGGGEASLLMEGRRKSFEEEKGGGEVQSLLLLSSQGEGRFRLFLWGRKESDRERGGYWASFEWGGRRGEEGESNPYTCLPEIGTGKGVSSASDRSGVGERGGCFWRVGQHQVPPKPQPQKAANKFPKTPPKERTPPPPQPHSNPLPKK